MQSRNRRGIVCLSSLALFTAGCDDGLDIPAPPPGARLLLQPQSPAREIDPRFLSVAVDTAQVVGGLFWDPSGKVENGAGTFEVDPFDFTSPKLRALAAELAPAYLRIGGSAADETFYDMGDNPGEAPAPFEEVLTRAQWDGLNDFARALDFEVMFTLNAGPGPRDAEGVWQPDNARALIEYTVAAGHPITLWELGNEANGFPFVIDPTFTVSGEELARDFGALRALLDEVQPGVRLGGPASAYWPTLGEINPVFPDFMEAGGGAFLDVITWHFYPQQSRRCPVAVLRAEPFLMLEPERLGEVEEWAAEIEAARDAHAPGAEVWLGETGHAQCGGEPGVSETFVASFWWLDQLGTLARRGHQVVVRQTLSGSNYGLLEDITLTPRPDYWASVLWRRLMGTKVLDLTVTGEPAVRAYAHCTRGGAPGSVTLLLLNIDRERALEVSLEGFSGGPGELYLVTAEDLLGQGVFLNGTLLTAAEDGTLPALLPVAGEIEGDALLSLPPTSYAFVVLPGLDAEACR